MSWNYRIVKKTDKATGEVFYGIHENYTIDGEEGWTANPVRVEAESVPGIKWMLEHMALALDRPIIEDTE